MSRKTVAVSVALAVSALAALPVAGQGVVPGALGPAPQPKITASLPTPSVKPGGGDAAAVDAQKAELAAAIAAGDIARAFELGAGPNEIYRMERELYPRLAPLDEAGAMFLMDSGRLAVGLMTRAADGRLVYSGPSVSLPRMALPEDVHYPTALEAKGLVLSFPPPGPTTDAEIAVAARAQTAASAPEVARTLVGLRPDLAGFEPASAQFTRGEGGYVLVRMTSPDGREATVYLASAPEAPAAPAEK